MRQFHRLPLIALLGLFALVSQSHAQQAQPPKTGPGTTDKPVVKERLIELDIPFPVAVLDVGVGGGARRAQEERGGRPLDQALVELEPDVVVVLARDEHALSIIERPFERKGRKLS